MPVLESEALQRENKKMLPQWVLNSQTSYSKSNTPFCTNLTFACKTKTLGSLYSNVQLIIAKSSQFLQVQKSSGA